MLGFDGGEWDEVRGNVILVSWLAVSNIDVEWNEGGNVLAVHRLFIIIVESLWLKS